MFKSMSNLEQQLYFNLGEKEQRVFTLKDITNILNISLQHARKLASNMVKKNVVKRVKPGLFVRIPESVILDKHLYKEDAVLIAARSSEESFLSHYTALSIYGLAERYVTRVYVTTSHHQRDIIYHDVHIKFITVLPNRFFGFKRIEYSNEKVNVSDQERTILDIINRPRYAGGWSEMISCLKNLENVDWSNLLSYIKRLGNKALARRVGYIMDHLENVSIPTKIKDDIKKYSGRNIYYFDSTKKGVFETEWNLIVPQIIQEALHAY